MKKVLTLVTLMVLGLPAGAFAQQAAAPRTAFRTSLDAGVVKAIDSREIEKRFEGAKPSSVMLSLYGSLAALNVADILSTRAAIARGGVERNPLMKDAVGSNNLSFGIKAATTVGTVLMLERMRKRSPKAALVSAIIANGITAAVVAHNMRQGR